MADTSWLIGSVTFAGNMSLSISSSDETVPAGTYYLRDVTDARSLIAAVLAAMTSAGVASPSVYLDRAGFVHIAAGEAFTVVWTDALLRDMLGFTGNIASTTNATAGRRSRLFWSPGWPSTPSTPVGVAGYDVADTQITSSPTGLTVRHTTHHVARWQEYAWSSVSVDRVWTTAELGGEYIRWWRHVVRGGNRFKIYEGIAEDRSSTSAVTWTSAVGPYKARAIGSPNWYNRGSIGLADMIADVDIRAVVVAEDG